MPLASLRWHDLLLPAIRLALQDSEDAETDFTERQAVDLGSAERAVVFDCRQLPPEFIKDTGDAAFEEFEALRQPVRLPFPMCYFELDDGNTGILAQECGHYAGVELTDESIAAMGFDEPPDGEPLGTTVEFCSFHSWPNEDDPDSPDDYRRLPQQEYWRDFSGVSETAYGEFGNGVITPGFDEPSPFFSVVNQLHAASGIYLDADARLLVGLLALMNEHLIATEIRPDPAPFINQARKKKGKSPLSSETRMLTLNVGAVRHKAASARLLAHESPRLHWRRGHWRHLHRYSEFESRTWVRRCLVGDPARGSVHKDYRLVWQPPMLEAAAPGAG